MLLNAGQRPVALLTKTIDLWSSKNAFQHAGALAFYTLFSLAPLLIILITIAGAVLGEEAARGEIAGQIDDLIGPQAAEAVQGAVSRARLSEAGLLPTALGVAALLLGSTTVFAQLQASLNQVWDVVAKPSRSSILVFLTTRLASLSLVVIIGFLLLTSFVISMSIAAVIQFAEEWIPVPSGVVAAIDIAASLLIATLLFAMIFKILPDVRLHWRDMWRGAFITALLFVGGQSLISLYLTRAAPASTYGAAGSLVMVLLWVYYSSLILFFGAALTRATIGLRGDRIVPKATAVRVKMEILEDPNERTMTKGAEVDTGRIEAS
jgi:membrane protein